MTQKTYELERDDILRLNKNVVERFKKHVHTPESPKFNPCWEWTGAKNAKGYGEFIVKLPVVGWKRVKAHRVAYALQTGSTPTHLEISHSCHNTSCVDPSHLMACDAEQNRRELAEYEERTKGVPKDVLGPPNIAHKRLWPGWKVPKWDKFMDDLEADQAEAVKMIQADPDIFSAPIWANLPDDKRLPYERELSDYQIIMLQDQYTFDDLCKADPDTVIKGIYFVEAGSQTELDWLFLIMSDPEKAALQINA